MGLRLYLFGTCRVESAIRPLDRRAASPRQLALLALTGACEGGMTRDRLACYLWPEKPAAAARHLVADALHVLARSLGEQPLLTSGENIALDPSRITCDVRDFRVAHAIRDWERMLEFYEGPFLHGFYGAGGAAFERWAEDERIRCREVALQAAIALADRVEAGGDWPAALQWLRRGRAIDPIDERLTRRLMALCARAGDRAGAVRTYGEFAERLRCELDLEPSPELRALLEQIQGGHMASRPPASTRPAVVRDQT